MDELPRFAVVCTVRNTCIYRPVKLTAPKCLGLTLLVPLPLLCDFFTAPVESIHEFTFPFYRATQPATVAKGEPRRPVSLGQELPANPLR
jgi:hypothetical protein